MLSGTFSSTPRGRRNRTALDLIAIPFEIQISVLGLHMDWLPAGFVGISMPMTRPEIRPVEENAHISAPGTMMRPAVTALTF
jgi:hypothetical protein